MILKNILRIIFDILDLRDMFYIAKDNHMENQKMRTRTKYARFVGCQFFVIVFSPNGTGFFLNI